MSSRPKRGAVSEPTSSKTEKKGKTGLAVGDDLPEFEVETDASTEASPNTITSKELVADAGAIIFFYPRANTGGCTTQACGFRDNYDQLVKSGYKVYGMSADKPKSQASWKAKHNFQYPLLCDPSFKVLKALGVNKGDKSVRRSHIVIAKGGKIEQLHYDISPKDSIAEAAKLISSGAAAGSSAGKEPAAEPESSTKAETKKEKAGLAVGDDLPEFEVETDESTEDALKKITSKELVADSGAIIFFYPRANTPGCTTQACGFRDNYDQLVASGYKVYGMSADKPKSQANWRAKHSFPYPLLCDPSFKVLKALGVNKGDKSVRRSHIVIAKGGKIEQLHYDISPKDSIAEAAKLISEGK